MKKILIGLASLMTATSLFATPVPRDDAKLRVTELLDVAAIVCPANPTPEMMRAAARDARFSKRDSDVIIALCAMYHLGRRDVHREAILQGLR